METNSYHHKDLRQELIDTGVRLVAQEGADSLSLRRLAAECGVTHAAPYKHFQNKDAILKAVTVQLYQIFARQLQRVLEAHSAADPRERLIQLGKCYVSFTLEHPEFARLMFFYGESNRATPEKLVENGETECSALAVFRDAALEYLRSIQAPPEEYEYRIVSLWSLVHGLAALLQNHNWEPGEDAAQAAEKVLRASC